MALPPVPLLLLAGLLIVLLVRAVWETIALRKVPDRSGREYDIPRVASYLRDLGKTFALLPSRAWTDLDMDDVFQ